MSVDTGVFWDRTLGELLKLCLFRIGGVNLGRQVDSTLCRGVNFDEICALEEGIRSVRKKMLI
jgi:hypothetical protein